MVVFSRLILNAALLGSVLATPRSHQAKHATHRVRSLPNGVEVASYSPPSKFETFGSGIDHPLLKRGETANIRDSSVSFVSWRLGFSEDEISFKKSFTDPVATHAYLRQKINGTDVANAVANIALNSEDRVVTFGANFVKPERVSSLEPEISSEDAISTAEQFLDAKYIGYPTSLEFFAKDDGSVVLTHVVQVENSHRLEVFVDAETGEVVAVNDFTYESAFLAIPVGRQGLNEGQERIENPEDVIASPDGWNTNSTGTLGNNVLVCRDVTSNITQESFPGLVFEYSADDSLDPTEGTNVDAARTNAFYVSNTIHDITYRYGFTESSFNFQTDNFGNGGAENDEIRIYVQDGGFNNAFFHAPPDGEPGIMMLYLWSYTTPPRDGALQNDIVAHENTHGLTARLTGGGTGRCLQTVESVGLSEGWSDAFADWLEQTPEIHDFTTGSYVLNNTDGIRTYPYSTNKTVNPLMYSDLQVLTQVHSIGEIWAVTLHDVLAALVSEYGFSTEAYTNPDGTEGNVVFLHLFIDQLSIQPCNPTFLQARDAWIQADENRYAGANRCLLWRAFAGRGLGINAINQEDDDTIPDDC